MNQESLTHYIFVEWTHAGLDEPVHLYYELDAHRREQRKVEAYQSGIMHSADAAHGQGTTFLAWEPHPPLAEIESDPQFRVHEITTQEFERVWQRAASHDLEPAAV